jgi:hypothetical protein
MIDTAGAQRALTLITTDMDARQRLLAHYRGDEDPVSALRELLDPAQPSAATIARLERAARLQSVAYGRAVSTEDREAAAQAQDELAWDRAHAAEIREEIEAAVAAFLAERDAQGTSAGSDAEHSGGSGSHATAPGERRHRRRSIRALWLVPAVAVALAAGGVVGGLIVGGSFGGSAAHSAHGVTSTGKPAPKPTHSTVLLSSQPIDKRMAAVLTAITNQTSVDTTLDAERWFLGPQSAKDRAIPEEQLGDITKSSMRLIVSNRDGTGVWIGKPSQGGFCLFDFEADGLNGDCTALPGSSALTLSRSTMARTW